MGTIARGRISGQRTGGYLKSPEWLAEQARLTAAESGLEVGGEVVATAIGTLELGVPNPHCPQGRTVRLANVLTLPAHRGHGFATLLVRDVVAWARSVQADRVDLSATSEGQRHYARLGFQVARAPRMKLVL